MNKSVIAENGNSIHVPSGKDSPSPLGCRIDEDGALEFHEKEGGKACDCVLCVSSRPWAEHKESQRLEKIDGDRLPPTEGDFRDDLDQDDLGAVVTV